MNSLKVEDTEILSPIKRKKGLPCAVGRTCLDAYCKKRIYNLSEAQIKTLERLEALTEDDGIERIPNICDVKGCRKRVYPSSLGYLFALRLSANTLTYQRFSVILSLRKAE
jgi:hypothetical protein